MISPNVERIHTVIERVDLPEGWKGFDYQTEKEILCTSRFKGFAGPPAGFPFTSPSKTSCYECLMKWSQ